MPPCQNSKKPNSSDVVMAAPTVAAGRSRAVGGPLLFQNRMAHRIAQVAGRADQVPPEHPLLGHPRVQSDFATRRIVPVAPPREPLPRPLGEYAGIPRRFAAEGEGSGAGAGEKPEVRLQVVRRHYREDRRR